MTTHLELHAFELDRFPMGSSSGCWIRLFELPGWGPVEVPAIVARGRESGPLLFTVAGIHGNEYEGMEAIRQVSAALDPASMRGTFAALVTANPFAYAARNRESPSRIDGLNLARVFPGDANGSPTLRLAAALFGLIVRSVGPDDLHLDLHSGTAEVAFATMAGYRAVSGPARVRSEEAARHLGLPLLWEIPDSPGPLNAETSRIGIPTVGTETTGRAGCRTKDVALYRQGLRNLLAYLGICPDWKRPIRDDRNARSTVDVLAPAGGFLRLESRLHAEVSAGERIGVVIDPFGTSIAEVTSPVTGTVWAVRETPHVDAGDLMLMIAERGDQ
jgi:N2-acetyl-L-2,4-diaminobutanoate deacetylase